MTAAVRVFFIGGLNVGHVEGGSRLSYDSLQMIRWPYLGRNLLSPDTSTAATTDAVQALANTKMALIQVQAGKQVHFEYTPANADLRTVDMSSPIIKGDTMVTCGPGDRLSFREVT